MNHKDENSNSAPERSPILLILDNIDDLSLHIGSIKLLSNDELDNMRL